MKRKRKIFYFLKTKEEYDYMLLNNLIPRRGIVLIESTQEIYRDKLPYSGYGPLKEKIESIKNEYKEYTNSKHLEIQDLIKLTKSSIKTDYTTEIDKYKDKISKLENKVYDLETLLLNMSTTLLNMETSLNSLFVLVSDQALIYNSENMINLT